MTDCSNVEMRERLPELVHDALAAGERAAVLAHVASCPECADELELLREAQRVLHGAPVPVVDTAAIVAALPRPRVMAASRPAMRRSPTLFRIAAAISFISIGGISVAVARSYMGQAAPTVVDSLRTDTMARADGIPTIAANDRGAGDDRGGRRPRARRASVDRRARRCRPRVAARRAR